MYTKVACIAALVAVVVGQHSHHGVAPHHGPAHSSVHVTRHHGPVHKVVMHTHEERSHGLGHESGHGHGHGHGREHIDYHAHPMYEFEYKVDDPHTHDHKSQHEHRDGDVVKGHYSLHEPDGSIRHVEYHADQHSGFQANVKHITQHHVPAHHHHHHE